MERWSNEVMECWSAGMISDGDCVASGGVGHRSRERFMADRGPAFTGALIISAANAAPGKPFGPEALNNPTLHHSNTPSLHYSNAPLLHHANTPVA
jgi:hypothetical protein